MRKINNLVCTIHVTDNCKQVGLTPMTRRWYLIDNVKVYQLCAVSPSGLIRFIKFYLM